MKLCRSLMMGLVLILVAVALAAACTKSTVDNRTPAVSDTRLSPEADWNNTVAQAKAEGKLNLYTNMAPQTRDAVTKAFKEKYGINIELTLGASSEITQKIITERRANLNIWDVLLAGPTEISLKPEGVLAPIDKVLVLPEVTDVKAWPQDRIPYLDKDKTVVMLTGGYLSYLIANTELVKPADITSLQDLLKPQFKEKIVMDDPTIVRSGSNWVSFLAKYVMGPDKAKEYLRKLVAQQPVLVRDYRQGAEWVAKGKSLVGIGISQEITTGFQRDGAPIGYVRVAEGGLVHPGGSCVFLSNKPEHPRVATLFINWLMTEEGQAIYSTAFGKPSLRRGVKTEGLDPFTIPPTDAKVYYIDEDFINYTLNDGLAISKEIFTPLLR